MKVLVVEDEPAIRESLAYSLKREAYTVDVASSVSEASRKLTDVALVILDLMLPDGSGFDLLVGLRRLPRPPAVIVLSSRDSEADRVAGLETGADDYIVKPFSPREVMARVRAVLRRTSALAAAPSTMASPLTTDAETRRAAISGAALELTRVEFDLLHCLLEARGRVFTRAQLIERLWGDNFAITDRTVDSHVKALRRKVADAGGDPGILETVRGVGYRVSDGSTTPASGDDGDGTTA